MTSRIINRMAELMAMAGGAVLLLLMIMVVVSVLGRGLIGLPVPLPDWIGPVKGDFELVELGMGFVIFAFMPLCQLRRGHASVDLVVRFLPRRLQLWLDCLWDAVFLLVWVLIAWRLSLATSEKMCLAARLTEDWCNIETSFRLGIPSWWSYLPALIAAWVGALTALWCLYQQLRQGVVPASSNGCGAV